MKVHKIPKSLGVILCESGLVLVAEVLNVHVHTFRLYPAGSRLMGLSAHAPVCPLHTQGVDQTLSTTPALH